METIEVELAEGQPEVEVFLEEEPSSEGQPQAEVEPEAKPEQDQGLCEKLLDAIEELWNDERDTWFLVGKKLYQLQRERAKPGYGTFVRDVEDLGIALPTAYRRIHFYKDVKAGLREIQVERLYQRDKDKWGLEDADLKAELQEIEKRQADQRAKEGEEIKKQAREREQKQREREEKTGETAPLHVVIHLLLPQKKQAKQICKQLGPERTTEVVYTALLQAQAELEKTTQEEVVTDAQVYRSLTDEH